MIWGKYRRKKVSVRGEGVGVGGHLVRGKREPAYEIFRQLSGMIP